uniref:Uncharacterized protein n=1 Tax=Euplotes crassus TaxID=5936 RepID=A0A7S3NTX3_EUPCR|mmetsp:Transcript_21200/g.20880  ORF Transcript_21200/g.20880 Transcript_21200/m.20880 type:complete len:103 (+) Transcript_21200:41-349(+)|eukprot:CAMPEP_0197011104 /NCGR_PEP_ID=MMETSP1380-20130617/57091_1 /TAXON_ID=5936 /ORGANISM="Euplotes crassus, Strain CT5" /LENGTH=102 /DNA_ID=CAMNT_0042433521 /DNA_START=23 /DNA_END=331 /DNA_ORIENTATION=+
MDLTQPPRVENEEEKTAAEIEAELNSMYSKIMFRTTAQTVGETATKGGVTGSGEKNDAKHGKSSRFSGHLGTAGMYRNAGLNTHVERDKVYDGSKDWMDKIS